MKRMTVSVLALALSAVAGGASAGFQDYGSRYDNRYDDDRDRVISAPRSDIATVVRVEPMYNGRGDGYGGGYDGGYQRQECWNESANRYDGGYYRDSNGRLYRGDYRNNNNTNGGSTLLGALIGGALGNQVGKGDGRKAATIAGAVIGGAIANNNADGRYTDGRNYDEYRDDRGVVRRCRIVTEPGYGGGQANGYNVTYRYAGQTYQAYTRYRPGRTMRVMVEVRPQDGAAYRR